MSETKKNQAVQQGAGVSGSASAAPSADAKPEKLSLSELCQNPFWQAALTSQSILLWIVSNLPTADFPAL